MHAFKSLAVAALLASVVGCSSHKTYSANGTTVTTDDGNKNVTITTKDGTATVGKGAVDLAKIGAPVYPGAQQGDGGFSVSAANGNQQMVTLTTTDDFDKVYDWYKSQLPKEAEKMKMASGDNSVAEFAVGGDAKGDVQTAVTITGKKDGTSIMIVKGAK